MKRVSQREEIGLGWTERPEVRISTKNKNAERLEERRMKEVEREQNCFIFFFFFLLSKLLRLRKENKKERKKSND